MSLDQNLFTLNFTQDEQNPHIANLVDPSGTPHYTRRRIPGNDYKIEVYEPLSQSLLATVSAPAPTSKAKTIELHNPSVTLELKSTGTLSFRWSFKWEEHEFEWKREECFMVRKPDPPVLVAITKEPAGKIKTAAIQILDYNLNRFDIDDRKGLEIVILTALLTFQDLNSTYHDPDASANPTSSLNRQGSALGAPPPPPPRPAPKTGVDRIAEMQAMRGEINEITVEEEVSVNDYAEYCSRLLQDEAMLFITVKSANAEQVPKVLQVVEETKRIRHKAGLSEETKLHQYVLYDTVGKPKRIVLDDKAASKNKYTPPDSLAVHLSKIDMPELRPKASGNKDKTGKKDKKKEKEPPAKPTTPPPATRPSSKSQAKKQKQSPSSSNSPPQPSIDVAGPPPHSQPPGSHADGPPLSMAFPTPQVPSWNGPTGVPDDATARPHSPPSPNPTAGALLSASPPSATQKPASVVSGLLGSFRRR